MERTPTFGGHEMTMLAGADIMTGLDQNEAAALRACATVRLCDPHEILFEEGERAAYFYCVLSGYIRLYRSNGDNRFADIRICEPGDSFAECLIHAEAIYPYGAQAVDDSVLACFDIARVRPLLDERPRIGKAIMRSLSLHLISTMECLAGDADRAAARRPLSADPLHRKRCGRPAATLSERPACPQAGSRAGSALARLLDAEDSRCDGPRPGHRNQQRRCAAAALTVLVAMRGNPSRLEPFRVRLKHSVGSNGVGWSTGRRAS
jgi:CRP-like cAMP-binding protein